ncbi:ankyrin repeat domain-containing protein [Legionella massiliensis]|uniref:ankyrin repeat domain-containing protein n=1 Tax=Legionella massiliensis TaxID=1034943 RepID=UPI0005C359F9|nr:ankyrin repeat domain-containing protein [Legionella massiliensis]
MLQIYQDKNELKSLVSLLCTNEAAVTTILESHFRISWPKDYQKIISATYEIAIAHLSAPHFDELRVACVPELVNSKQYTVMGGRLYWSIEPIYEKGTINTVQEQSKISVDHFALFYDNCQSYFHRMNTMVLLSEMLHQNLDPEGETGLAEWAIKHNIDRLSEKNKSELLNVAINNKKHKFASFLIERCAGYYPIAFKSLLNSKPLNAELIEQFIKKDTGYLHALKGADLVENLYKANLSEFALDKIKIYLKFKPDLLEYKDACQQTPFLWACAQGNADIVEYLMDLGANIHVKTLLPESYNLQGKEETTARQWAESNSIASKQIIALFDNYYQRMESNFQAIPGYSKRFNSQHLRQALDNKDLQLTDLLCKYCPNLGDSLSEADLQGIKQLRKEEQESLGGKQQQFRGTFFKSKDEVQTNFAQEFEQDTNTLKTVMVDVIGNEDPTESRDLSLA